MSTLFVILTVAFIVVSAAMVLIILVQRPQGGGLAGAFGGAGGGGTETVFGGRVGDALTVMTVCAFLAYMGLAIALNLMDSSGQATAQAISSDDTPAIVDGDGNAETTVPDEPSLTPSPTPTPAETP